MYTYRLLQLAWYSHSWLIRDWYLHGTCKNYLRTVRKIRPRVTWTSGLLEGSGEEEKSEGIKGRIICLRKLPILSNVPAKSVLRTIVFALGFTLLENVLKKRKFQKMEDRSCLFPRNFPVGWTKIALTIFLNPKFRAWWAGREGASESGLGLEVSDDRNLWALAVTILLSLLRSHFWDVTQRSTKERKKKVSLGWGWGGSVAWHVKKRLRWRQVTPQVAQAL